MIAKSINVESEALPSYGNRVLFYDTVCPKQYDLHTLETEALGGTEATVIRVAHALAKLGKRVTMAQHNRHAFKNVQGVSYLNPSLSAQDDYDTIVLIRNFSAIPELSVRYKNAKIIVWLHDLAAPWLLMNSEVIKKYKPLIITVSDFHKTNIQQALRSHLDVLDMPPVKRIYNPLAEYCNRERSEAHDPDKLIFFSSPHKGLLDTLKLFVRLKTFNPNFKLYIANPGYLELPDNLGDLTDVVILNKLPHKEVIEHVKNSLCVFYPNYVFPETFGLVLAEANAVGTPVLTHRHGAAGEVLCHPAETVDCREIKAVVDRVMSWYNGSRPIVKGKDDFNLSHIAKQWMKIL